MQVFFPLKKKKEIFLLSFKKRTLKQVRDNKNKRYQTEKKKKKTRIKDKVYQKTIKKNLNNSHVFLYNIIFSIPWLFKKNLFSIPCLNLFYSKKKRNQEKIIPTFVFYSFF